MKKSTQELLFFIFSMTKQEKIWFHQYSSLKKGKVEERQEYGELYDYLSNFSEINEYNEDQLRIHFRGKAFLKNLSRLKKYLFDVLLDALALFYFEHDAELLKLERKITISIKKGAISKAYKLTIKGKHLAIKQENFAVLKSFLSKQRTLIYLMNELSLEDKMEQIRIVRNEIQEAISLDTEFRVFQDLYDDYKYEIQASIKENWKPNREILEKFEKDVDAAISTYKINSRKALLFKHRINRARAGFHLDIKASYWEAKKVIEVFQTNPHLGEVFKEGYLSELYQYSRLSLANDDLESFKNCIIELENIKSPNSRINAQKFFYIYSSKISFQSKELDQKAYQALIDEFNEQFVRHKKALSEEHFVWLCFAMGRHFFEKNSANIALQWFLRILQKPTIKQTTQLQVFARVFLISIYFLRGDSEEIDRIKRQFVSYIKKNCESDSLLLFAKGICNTSKSFHIEQSIGFLQGLLEKIEEKLSENPNEKYYLTHFNFYIWLKERVS